MRAVPKHLTPALALLVTILCVYLHMTGYAAKLESKYNELSDPSNGVTQLRMIIEPRRPE